MIKLSSMRAAFAVGIILPACLGVPCALAEPISVFESPTKFGATGYTLNLRNAALGSIAPYTSGKYQVSFVGTASDQGVVRGSSPGNYSAPVTDEAGDAFRGKYFSTGNAGYIDIAFAKPEQSLSLLWGSIDASNQITFLNGNAVVGVVDGAEIEADETGAQDPGGSAYVLLESAVKFNTIEISSAVPSFEFAALSAAPNEIPVHEPASLALFGTGLLGLVGFRWRPW